MTPEELSKILFVCIMLPVAMLIAWLVNDDDDFGEPDQRT